MDLVYCFGKGEEEKVKALETKVKKIKKSLKILKKKSIRNVRT